MVIPGFIQGGITLVSYTPKPNKQVVLLSTMHHSPEENETTKKPEKMMYYNKTKGGVDSLYQLVHIYILLGRNTQ